MVPTSRYEAGLNENLDRRFRHHPPKDDQTGRYEHIRSVLKDAAEMVCELTPPSRERALSLTKLEEAMMWANAAIARNE